MNGPAACAECAEYARVRASVLAPAIARRAFATHENPRDVSSRYMAGVHLRHLSGKPILPARAAS